MQYFYESILISSKQKYLFVTGIAKKYLMIKNDFDTCFEADIANKPISSKTLILSAGFHLITSNVKRKRHINIS
jgi:hypothetical protein